MILFSCFLCTFEQPRASRNLVGLLGQDKPLPPQIPSESRLETELLERVNTERARAHLSQLTLSPKLRDLAREHSADMAAHQSLSHVSSSGKDYVRRLVDGDIYFLEAGENVAFSETFDAGSIHKSFTDSQEHRENILAPDYNEVGIGVVLSKGRGYYITQDFLTTFSVRNENDVRREAQSLIDKKRAKKGLPPLEYFSNHEPFAEALSRARAEGRNLPPFPEEFGAVRALFIVSPSVARASAYFEDVQNSAYEGLSLGVTFGRDGEHPGGAYVITALLFLRDRYARLSVQDVERIVLEKINSLRGQAGLGPLEPDKNLSALAQRIDLLAMGKTVFPGDISKAAAGLGVFSYVTEDPELLPAELRTRISITKSAKIGIGLLLEERGPGSRRTYWITVLF